MKEDTELVADVLAWTRATAIAALGYFPGDRETRIRLARVNAEIARRIPQWAYGTAAERVA